MVYLQKLASLARTFTQKLGQQISQSGTTELFFGSGDKQQAFATAIQNPQGAVYKTLLNIFNKMGGKATVSFNLKVEAQGGKGARWILTSTPPTVAKFITPLLDQEFQRVTGTSMQGQLKAAIQGAKAGGGAGALDVGSLELSP